MMHFGSFVAHTIRMLLHVEFDDCGKWSEIQGIKRREIMKLLSVGAFLFVIGILFGIKTKPIAHYIDSNLSDTAFAQGNPSCRIVFGQERLFYSDTVRCPEGEVLVGYFLEDVGNAESLERLLCRPISITCSNH